MAYKPYNSSNKYGNRKDREEKPVEKKNCYCCMNKISSLDYKDTNLIRRFMSPHAKIMGRKRTGSCPKHQRMVTQALKRARHMALLPFVAA
ncbi:MAG TPA: 30S ribosomal protein S18 [Patescibacteria group bacterium]|nr:30S ribosomal protein S18 [Patescibacteria group bacterium]